MGSTSGIKRSPRALLIFEAVVRTGSCTAAAREFNLTQPSVSRNIAELEAAIATPLFVRKPSGLEPTPEALLLYRAVSDSVSRIDATIEAIRHRSSRRQPVVLSLSTAFVTHWFVPRMRAFHEAFPDVDLRFELRSGALRGPPGNVDLAMRRTASPETDEHIAPFLPEIVVPVCSRPYLDRTGLMAADATGSDHVLLELPGNEIGWRTLLGPRVEPLIKGGRWLEFSDYAVVLQAAIGGQGIALGWLSAVSRTLANGTLVPAAPLRLETGHTFSLISPRGRPVRAIVHRVRDWMVGEMRREYEALLPLLPPKVLRKAPAVESARQKRAQRNGRWADAGTEA